jgi:hypothetical protein
MQEKDNFVFKNIPELKPYDFILSIDILDKPVCVYALFKRVIGEQPYCINIKKSMTMIYLLKKFRIFKNILILLL